VPVEPADDREQDEPDDTPRYDYAAMAEAAKHWAKKPQQTREAEKSQTETEAGDVSEPVELIELSDDSEPDEPHIASRHSIDMETLKQKIKMNLGKKPQKATEAGDLSQQEELSSEDNRDRSAQSHQSEGR